MSEITVKGIVTIKDRKTGKVILEKENLITDAGLAHLALLVGNADAQPFALGCIGASNTTPQATDTDLGSQLDYKNATYARVTTNVNNDTAEFRTIHTAGAGGWAICEYGLKTLGGILLNRVVFSAVNLPEGNEFEFIYRVVFGRRSA